MAVVGDARPDPGPRTLGRYELMASIGTGGMAEVHLARQRGPMGFEKLVVVKTVHEHLAAQRDFIDMLLEEARIAALVKHANVVDIYDLGEADGAYFIAMEYLEGEPLLAILRAGKQGRRLDPLSTIRLIADCAEGLHAAHELHAMSGQPLAVVHHDVSPGNIMVLYSGEVKLVDFGVAKAEHRVEAAGERVLMKGKTSYMAPEKLRGASGDRRSDVFSLGVVLWEALTLRRLFRGDTDKEVARMIVESTVPAPSTIGPDIPREVDAIVARALAKDPQTRFATAKAMAAALEELLRAAGYSGKNDKIGEYMRATFGDRLAARRELIRSMSQSGAAPSAQAIARAFRRTETVAPPLSAASSGVGFTPPPSTGTPPLPLPRTPALPPAVAAAHPALPTSPVPPGVARTSDAADPTPARRDGVLVGALIALGLVVVVVGIVLTRGGRPAREAEVAAPVAAAAVAPGEPAELAMDPVEARPSRAGTPAPVGDPAAPVGASATAPHAGRERAHDRPGKGSEHGRADKPPPPPETAKIAPEAPPPAPAPAASPADLVKEGSKQFVAGRARDALASFEAARSHAPGFAPAYRGIGMAKAQLGDRAGAAAAFRKYLELAPNAKDAAAIKARLEKL